ncbi:hypothetical protein B4102_2120 [Heyndrickxia sporothermodurans]|uniref:Uncharacterized protein n=1 Tax=Heyndrickxia sporothermodurans TaxID=46224 RepID=A0A150LHF6_9BACI|nr:hypothetical protein B4102_2120 [Heyndrickxia sporothermodurans]
MSKNHQTRNTQKSRIKEIEHQNSVTSVYKPNNDGASHTLFG